MLLKWARFERKKMLSQPKNSKNEQEHKNLSEQLDLLQNKIEAKPGSFNKGILNAKSNISYTEASRNHGKTLLYRTLRIITQSDARPTPISIFARRQQSNPINLRHPLSGVYCTMVLKTKSAG